jgi:type IV pilus assembly protein PilB
MALAAAALASRQNGKIPRLDYTEILCSIRQPMSQTARTIPFDTLPGGLAGKLVSACLLDHDAAVEAGGVAGRTGVPIIRHLVHSGVLDSRVIAETAAREYRLPFFNLAAMDTRQLPLSLVDVRLIRKHNVLPLMQRGNRLFLALSDPSDVNAINEVRFHASAAVELVLVEDDKLHATINALFDEGGAEPGHYSELETMGLEDIDIELIDEETQGSDDASREADEAPVVRFVNKILLDAIKSGASDIHVEPYEKVYRVRYRLDGILKEIARPPLAIATRICSRLKIMSSMDIAEKRTPQDGRIKLKLSRSRAVDFRVNTLPTLWGEKIVLRILDPGSAQLGIDALGYEPEQKQLYLNALSQHQGLILVTGPTGSGKTVSLYSGLNILNTHERNISTAEDPVEINLEGINQVAVNAKVGLTFASALRAFLRQDPDVVMVGEIRDLETAEIAIKAAQTGHLVLSTLHTNSAPETLTRLMNMGIPSYNLATSVTLIIAQRLARRLCPHCRKLLKLPGHILMQEGFSEQQSDNLALYGATGCEKCNEGYKGRVGIYEVLPINDRIARAIMNNASSIEIADIARELGFNNLRASALDKVAAGLTSLAEVNRLT